MKNKFRIVEIIPHLFCFKYEQASPEKFNILKGLVIKKELGKCNYLLYSGENTIIDQLNFFSIRTCITKIRVLDLERQLYVNALELFRYNPFIQNLYLSWKPIWKNEEAEEKKDEDVKHNLDTTSMHYYAVSELNLESLFNDEE